MGVWEGVAYFKNIFDSDHEGPGESLNSLFVFGILRVDMKPRPLVWR